jgi:hypothetical protein
MLNGDPAQAKLQAANLIAKYGVRGTVDAVADAIELMVGRNQPIRWLNDPENTLANHKALNVAKGLRANLLLY